MLAGFIGDVKYDAGQWERPRPVSLASPGYPPPPDPHPPITALGEGSTSGPISCGAGHAQHTARTHPTHTYIERAQDAVTRNTCSPLATTPVFS